MATYTEQTMHPETRRMLPDLGIEQALGLRDAERTLLRFHLMRHPEESKVYCPVCGWRLGKAPHWPDSSGPSCPWRFCSSSW
jgi:hypothetical protein